MVESLGTQPEVKSYRTRTMIAAPIEVVWNTLVKTDEALPFFFGGVCQTKAGLKPGAKMRMAHTSGKIAMVVGEVLAFDPPHRYSHTFRMTNIDEPPATIIYELTEVAGGTQFDLIIENAVAGSKLEKQMVSGQTYISQNLKALIETGRPAFSGRMLMLMGPILPLFAPKVQRIENWPLD
ncbi:SRPBCC domain-containing protein [Maritimibacter sp. DP1N21-5]|uniref:SRPBCC domain-containing protein n=1 Tax=Maritimibacter sp. DP1N21-5 TaxID=2836867 RepID=UPI001C46D85B|nr:SRPBCC domain-containing protein [Maritimibacter sp. DP1N21-5]MBV7410041.1 SRPBCC domain-containing protein [Maritimibacter sp. DP1N21-5]